MERYKRMFRENESAITEIMKHIHLADEQKSLAGRESSADLSKYWHNVSEYLRVMVKRLKSPMDITPTQLILNSDMSKGDEAEKYAATIVWNILAKNR